MDGAGFEHRQSHFVFSATSRPVLGPTQPPIQRKPGFLPRGGGGHEVDHYLNLQPRLKMSEAVLCSLYVPSCRRQVQLYLAYVQFWVSRFMCTHLEKAGYSRIKGRGRHIRVFLQVKENHEKLSGIYWLSVGVRSFKAVIVPLVPYHVKLGLRIRQKTSGQVLFPLYKRWQDYVICC
jgi:hypothetical protein